MQTSRDDFIIAIRSAFLKKGTQQTFSLLVLISFSLILLILTSFNFKIINYAKMTIREGVYKSSLIVSAPEKFFKKMYFITSEHFSFYDEYQKDRLELEILRSKNLLNEFVIQENNRLKSIIDDYLIISDEIIAKILIDKQSPFAKSVIANKGSKHNIKLGMVALDGEYLVGKVIEVNYLTSRILLLSDFNSKIPVSIEPNGIQSIMSGTGKDYAIIEYVKEEYIIKDNSTVYTSGSGGLFKSGTPIGKIKNLDLKGEKQITFFSDFTQLNFVKILSYEEAKLKVQKKAKIKAAEVLKVEEKKIKVEEVLKVEEKKIKVEEVIKLTVDRPKIKNERNR